jgi:hypothetical protein
MGKATLGRCQPKYDYEGALMSLLASCYITDEDRAHEDFLVQCMRRGWRKNFERWTRNRGPPGRSEAAVRRFYEAVIGGREGLLEQIPFSLHRSRRGRIVGAFAGLKRRAVADNAQSSQGLPRRAKNRPQGRDGNRPLCDRPGASQLDEGDDLSLGFSATAPGSPARGPDSAPIACRTWRLGRTSTAAPRQLVQRIA